MRIICILREHRTILLRVPYERAILNNRFWFLFVIDVCALIRVHQSSPLESQQIRAKFRRIRRGKTTCNMCFWSRARARCGFISCVCVWNYIIQIVFKSNRWERLIIRSKNRSTSFTWTRAQEQIAWMIAVCSIKLFTIRFWFLRVLANWPYEQHTPLRVIF